MKKFHYLSAIAILLLFLSSYSYGQIVGLRAGLNMANMSMKYDGESMSDDFKMKPGFLIGTSFEHLSKQADILNV